MALVTDIKGECKAGTTPQTTLFASSGYASKSVLKTHRYPTRPARPKMKALSIKVAPVAFPIATAAPMEAVTIATSRVAFCQGVMAVTVSSTFAGGAGAGGGVGRGAGGKMLPLWTTNEPRTTSSFKSMEYFPSPPMLKRNLVTLLEYRVED